MKYTVNIALAALSATRKTLTISALVDDADEDRIGQLQLTGAVAPKQPGVLG